MRCLSLCLPILSAVSILGCSDSGRVAGPSQPPPRGAGEREPASYDVVIGGLGSSQPLAAWEPSRAEVAALGRKLETWRRSQPASTGQRNRNRPAPCDIPGPPQYHDLGCNDEGVCLEVWETVCGDIYFLLTEADGTSYWIGPGGCVGCAPF